MTTRNALLAMLLLTGVTVGRAEEHKSPPVTERVRSTAEHVGEKVSASATHAVAATKSGVGKAVTATGKALDKAGDAIERTVVKAKAKVAGKQATPAGSGAAHSTASQDASAH
jgi:ribosome-associated translation inhibitor RaiA